MRPIRIAVCGGASASSEALQLAFQVGVECARAGAVLLTGGGGGVMAAANHGAKSEDGMTIGIFPDSGGTAPKDIDLPIYTGLGQGRNLVLVLSAEAVIAVGGEWGTLSEIALASKHGRPVIALETWKLTPTENGLLDLPIEVEDAARAVALAIESARKRRA